MSFPYINAYHQFFDSSGSPLSSGTIEFRSPATNNLINSYPTADDADAQTNPNDNPLTLNASGAAATGLFLEDGVAYKVILKNAAGATVDTVDDVLCPRVANYYAVTAAETSAGVTPTNYQYEPGNVLRYGATGDGTTDDITAFDGATLSSDVIIVPGGYTFYLESTWTIATNNKTVIGFGTIKGNSGLSSGSSVIAITGDNCLVTDITIDQDNITAGRSITATGASDTVIRGVKNTNSQAAFIRADGAVTNLSVIDCETNSKGYGVWIQDPSASSSGLLVTGCRFMYPYGAGVGDGVEINAPTNGFSDAVISNNYISGYYGTASSAGMGVGFAKVSNLSITGNTIVDCDGDGIHVEDVSTNVSISGNNVSNCCRTTTNSSSGIAVVTACTDVSVTGNVVTDSNTKSAFSSTSATGDFCERITVAGNVFNGANTFAASLESVKDVVFSNNIITDADVSATGGQVGLRIAKFTTNVSLNILINGNIISDGTNGVRSIGVAASSCNYVIIEGNDLSGCTTPAPDLSTGNEVELRGNRLGTDAISGTFTLTSSATSKVVTNDNAFDTAHIDVFPLDAAAAAFSTGSYVSAVTKGTNFTLTHPSASGGETFGYRVT